MRTPSFWQHHNPLSYALLPFAALYGLGAAIDRALVKPRKAPLPVIAIGNATAGGAGKTPTTIALAAWLAARGETPHILSRGYGGKKRGPHRVDPQIDTASDVGDEALLLARHAPTWIGGNRLKSAIAAHAAGASILLADDALQHHPLHKDITILVVDATSGFGNGFLLPAGPLREPVTSAIKRCDLAILIGRQDTHTLEARLSAELPCLRASVIPACETPFLRNHHWLAFSGIAYPEKFFTTLRDYGAQIGATQSFADHHPFSEKDLQTLRLKAEAQHLHLITTEKDWVRIPPSHRETIHTLPVQLQFHAADTAGDVLETLLSHLRS